MRYAIYKRAERLRNSWVVYYEENGHVVDVRVFSNPFEAKRSAIAWERSTNWKYIKLAALATVLFFIGLMFI